VLIANRCSSSIFFYSRYISIFLNRNFEFFGIRYIKHDIILYCGNRRNKIMAFNNWPDWDEYFEILDWENEYKMMPIMCPPTCPPCHPNCHPSCPPNQSCPPRCPPQCPPQCPPCPPHRCQPDCPPCYPNCQPSCAPNCPPGKTACRPRILCPPLITGGGPGFCLPRILR
jgi:hypothetical protein